MSVESDRQELQKLLDNLNRLYNTNFQIVSEAKPVTTYQEELQKLIAGLQRQVNVLSDRINTLESIFQDIRSTIGDTL